MPDTTQAPDTSNPQPVKLGRNGKPKGTPGRPTGDGATREMTDERVEFVARMIVKLLYPGEIKRGFRQKFGDMSARTIENYIAHAKKLLEKQASMPPESARDLAVNGLLDIMRSGKPAERTGALRLWTEIHGLAAPTKMEHTGAKGESISIAVEARYDVTKLSIEQLATLREALEASQVKPDQLANVTPV